MSESAAVQETTDRLLSAIADVLEISDITDQLPSRAILIFETIDTDGDVKVDFVTTRDFASTDIIGLAHFVREVTMVEMLDE